MKYIAILLVLFVAAACAQETPTDQAIEIAQGAIETLEESNARLADLVEKTESQVVDGYDCPETLDSSAIAWLCSRTHFRNGFGTTVVGHDMLVAAVREVYEMRAELEALRGQSITGTLAADNFGTISSDLVATDLTVCLAVVDIHNTDDNGDGCLTPEELVTGEEIVTLRYLGEAEPQ